MADLFRRAQQQLSLSPGERAFLRLVEGLLIAAIVTALPIIAQILAGADLAHLDWPAFGRVALAVLVMAFLLALSKYAKAHGDSPIISQVAENAAQRVAQWGGVPNDVKQEVIPQLPPDPALDVTVLASEPVLSPAVTA